MRGRVNGYQVQYSHTDLCYGVVAHWMLGFSPQSSGKPSDHIIHAVQEWQECITQRGNTGEYHVSVM